MRIGYFAKTRLPSSAANTIQTMEMCAAFSDLGHSVTLFVVSETECQISTDDVFHQYDLASTFQITYLKIPQSRANRIAYLWSVLAAIGKIRKTLRTHEIDLVYARDVLACLVAARSGLPTVFESHAPVWEGLVEGLCFKRLLQNQKFRRLVVISEALKQVYECRFPGIGKRCTVAPDGARKPETVKQFATLRGDVSALKVGYVGHLYQGKGMEIISALGKRMPSTEFHIVGGNPEDIDLWKRNASDNVFFYGLVPRQELAEYFGAFDVCLLPNQPSVSASGASFAKRVTDIGTFTSPLKMFEYMAYGKAIIASDLPILREVLTDRSALLVSPCDIEGWKRAIDVFSKKVSREEFGRVAFHQFLRNYTWDHRARLVLSNLGP